MTAALIVAAVAACVALTVLGYIARPAGRGRGFGIVPPGEWARPGDSITVASYNVCGGKGLDGKRDIARAAEIACEFDIVGLQELRGLTWSAQPSQAEQLGRLTGAGWLFAPTRTRWFRDYRGNGLLSRFPVDHWERIPLVDKSGHRFRNLLIARVALDTPLWVLVTHLHTGVARDLQLRDVLEHFKQLRPAILLGDLNTRRDDPLLAGTLQDPDITDAIAEALGENDPQDRVDWIFTRGLEVTGGGMIDPGASDHPCFHIAFRRP